jgi:hypothetical protein
LAAAIPTSDNLAVRADEICPHLALADVEDQIEALAEKKSSGVSDAAIFRYPRGVRVSHVVPIWPRPH